MKVYYTKSLLHYYIMDKKCICTNQQNEPCSWTAKENKLYCMRHMIYDGIYNENALVKILYKEKRMLKF